MPARLEDANPLVRLNPMSTLSIPSLAPTILLTALLGPGGAPDSRTRFVPRPDIAPVPADEGRARNTDSH